MINIESVKRTFFYEPKDTHIAPRFINNTCSQCKFIGYTDDADIYYCTEQKTFVIEYEEPSDYRTSPVESMLLSVIHGYEHSENDRKWLEFLITHKLLEIKFDYKQD